MKKRINHYLRLLKKEICANIVAFSESSIANRRAAGVTRYVVKLAFRLQLVHTPKHKSCHLLLRSTCRSTRNLHQSKRVLSKREKKKE
jgi:hypothetical protein